VVLDPFLVPVDLLLGLVDRQIHGGEQFFVPFASHKVVLVFRINSNFNFLVGRILQIDRDFNHCYPVEIMEEFGRLLPNFRLVSFTQVPVPGGYFYLHGRMPPILVEAASFRDKRTNLGGGRHVKLG